MRALPAALVLLAGSGICAGLPGFPAPGSELKSLDLSGYTCVRGAQELACRRPESGSAVLYQVPVTGNTLVFQDGALTRVSVAFSETRFDDVLGAMRADLGPGEEGSELLKAGMGGTFANRFAVWRQNGHVLLLEQYFGRVVTSALTQMTREEFTRLMAVRESQRVRGARDL
jgi:hypothetical protein